MKLRIALLGLLTLSVSGCVTSSKYKALQAQFEEAQKKLGGLNSELGLSKDTNVALSEAKSALETQKADLEKQTTELKAQTDALATQKAQLEAEKNQLQAEKDALLAASAEKQKQYESLVGDLKKEVNDGQLKITQYQNMLTVDVADKILFDSGHADLKKDGVEVLKHVGEALAKSDKVIRVVGHTDNVPLSPGASFASNWELSCARAVTVVRFLQEQSKLPATRLVASGRGEFSPVAPNDTPANKQKNRRIEITLLDKNLVDAVEVKK